MHCSIPCIVQGYGPHYPKGKSTQHPKEVHSALTGGGNVRDWSVQGRLEGCIGALLFSLLPPLLYAVTNLGLPSDMQHVWSLLLLTLAPLLMLTTLQVSLHTTSCMQFLTCPVSCICNQRTAWVTHHNSCISCVPAHTELQAAVIVFANSDALSNSQLASSITARYSNWVLCLVICFQQGSCTAGWLMVADVRCWVSQGCLQTGAGPGTSRQPHRP